MIYLTMTLLESVYYYSKLLFWNNLIKYLLAADIGLHNTLGQHTGSADKLADDIIKGLHLRHCKYYSKHHKPLHHNL